MATTVGTTPARVHPSADQRLRMLWRALTRNSSALMGGVVFLLIVLSSILAPVLSPYDPIAQDASHRLEGISAAHLLGTDDLGRDIYTRLLYGSRTILIVPSVAVGLALVVGTLLGVLAGYYHGPVEILITRTVDVMLSFPLVLLAIIILVILGAGALNLILAIGISQIPLFTRVARSLALSVRSRDFVEAARSLGATDSRILAIHVLPNIVAVLLVQASTAMALAILNTTALNFLGLGIRPPEPDWGVMVSDFRRYVFDQPQLPLYPGAAIAVTVLCLNLLGDGLVELVDPTARRDLG